MSEGRILAVSLEVKSWATDLAACLGGFQADIAFLLSQILCFGGQSRKQNGVVTWQKQKSLDKKRMCGALGIKLLVQHQGWHLPVLTQR